MRSRISPLPSLHGSLPASQPAPIGSSLLFLTVLSFALVPLAHGQVSWTGNGDGVSWSDASNWSPETVPGAGDEVVIDYTPGSEYTIEVNSNRTISDLTVDSRDATLALDADLTVTGAYLHNFGTLDGSSDVTVDGALTWDNGTMTGEGTTVANGGGEISRGVLDGRRFVVSNGTVNRTDTFSGRDGGTIEIESGGTLDYQTNRSTYIESGSTSPPKILNRGTLRGNASGGPDISWTVENRGTVVAEAGSHLLIEGTLIDDGGTYRVAGTDGRLDLRPNADVTFTSNSTLESVAGGTLNLTHSSSGDTAPEITVSGTYDVNGTTKLGESSPAVDVLFTATSDVQSLGGDAFIVGDRANVTVESTAALAVSTLTLNFEGRFAVNSDLTVEETMTLNSSSARFESDDSLTVEGTLEWSGGTIAGSGTTVAAGGLSLPGGAGSSSNVKRLDAQTLLLPSETNGTYPGALFRGANGAVFKIENGSVFEIQDCCHLEEASGSSSPPHLLNRGTIEKTGGGDMRVEWPLENPGTIEAADGRIRFSGPVVDDAGTYRAAGGRIDFRPDTSVTLGAHSTLAVASGGQFTYEADRPLMTHGTVDVDGEVYSEPPLRIDGGTVTLTDPGTVIQGTIGSVTSDPDSVLHLVNGGELHGTGAITGDVLNDSGAVRPGGSDATGRINLQGTYAQQSGATLDLELGGPTSGDEYDRLDANTVDLEGTLGLSLTNGYVPGEDDLLEPLRWSKGRTGTFDGVNDETGGDVSLAVEYASGALHVFDGSLPDPPSAPSLSIEANAPPFSRTDTPIPLNLNLSSSSSLTVGLLDTENVSTVEMSTPSACPQDDAYENLKCRLAPFGVVPPEPPEDENYPFLNYISAESVLTDATDGSSSSSANKSDDSDGSVKTPLSNSARGRGLAKTTTRAAFIGSNGFSTGGTAQCESGGEQVSTSATMRTPIMTNESLDRCAAEAGTKVLESIGSAIIPGYDCYTLFKDVASQYNSGFQNGDMAAAMASNVLGALDCAGDAVPATKAIDVMRELNSQIRTANDFKTCFADDGSGEESGGAQTTCVTSIDPNDKHGPPGVRNAQYVSRQDSLSYTVFFENKEAATAPAQEVVVTDTLYTDRFDLSTLSFGPVVVADSSLTTPDDTLSFSKQVDLRPERDVIAQIEGTVDESTGIVTWTFTSMDPDSVGLDPNEGFLPPNETAPEGQGSVSYHVDVEDTLSSGRQFGRAAQIVFDENDPIDTQVWSNVLDIEPPSSTVDSLAPTQDNTTFSVEWSGSDAESGVRSYSVFVSENGGSFSEWISDTTATAATFEGSPGNSYSFYSVARDSVGHVEPDSGSPEASTQVASDAIPVELTEMNAVVNDDGAVSLRWTTASETGNAGFEVQRKTGREARYEKVGFVDGAGTTSSAQTYTYTDEDPPYAADSLVYRLTQIDTDGSRQTADPIPVNRGGPDQLELRKTFPNPAQTHATVQYAVPETIEQDGVTLRLYDVMGRRVRTISVESEGGRQEQRIDVRDLASGVYVLRLDTGDMTETRRLTVVR